MKVEIYSVKYLEMHNAAVSATGLLYRFYAGSLLMYSTKLMILVLFGTQLGFNVTLNFVFVFDIDSGLFIVEILYTSVTKTTKKWL